MTISTRHALRHAFLGSFATLAAVGLLGTSACGGDDEPSAAFSTPYKPGSATVVGNEKGGESIPSLSGCKDAACQEALGRCADDAAADVIVDADGNVVDVVCYDQDVSVDSVPADSVPEYDAGNKTVLVLDGKDDGLDVEGDVTISGNNAIVYGEGPDTSVIGGTLRIDKNNAKVRGVRVKGDLTIDKNDTKLLFCVVEGNLTISGNNTTMAECDVYGTVTITGENTTLVQDRFGSSDALSAKNLSCNGNVSFADANANFVVEDTEIGPAVTCNSKP